MKSETIGALAAALAKAQSQISGAVKDSANPFFRSKYADLEAVWEACRKPLTDNGLAVVQTSRYTPDGLMLVTTLLHSSGEWITGEMPVLVKDASPQAQGSGLTYARRYALAAIVGIYQTDDDGEAAQGRKPDLRLDPRGDLGKNADPAEVQAYVDKFKAAFDLDAEEKDIAFAVLDIHQTISANHDLYVAVGDALGSKLKSAIKAYIKMAKEQMK
jgi:hypothetical protein